MKCKKIKCKYYREDMCLFALKSESECILENYSFYEKKRC